MIIGIVFIIVGILIVMFPALLSMIVAAFLIMAGITLASISYHYKKIQREADNPFVDFFIRF
ncbi:MAG: DUF3096 domain-containing protein [Candidatus Omnitrophota bacterium]|nr:MAG: DUF3096 domain-containing protein [Candidatus Omnitrophota bacterium]